MKTHEAGGEHLGVDAEVADVALRDHGGDTARDPADAGLQGAPVMDERHRVAGNQALGLRGFGIGKLERLAVGVHEHIDLRELEAVSVLGSVAEGAREVLAHLDHEKPLRVGAGTVQLVDRCAGMQRQAHPAVCGHRRCRGHHTRVEPPQHRLEATEVGRHEVDVGTGVAQEPLGRAEEPAAVPHALPHEQLVQIGEQRTEHLEMREVVALAERVEETGGDSRSERNCEAVVGAHPRDRLLHRCELHCVPILPAAMQPEARR